MKKRILTLIFVFAIMLCLFTSCKKKDPDKDIGDKQVDVYQLTLVQPSVTLTVTEVQDYDYKSLFILKLNDKKIEIADELVTSNVVPRVGEYVYKVSVDNQTQILLVKVIEDILDIKVLSKVEKIKLTDKEAINYDFKSLFEIKENDNDVKVLDSYLSQISLTPGVHELTCSYKGVTTKIVVEIEKTVEIIYEIELSVSEITINKSLAKTYDYKSLFTFKINGKITPITDDMIENNVEESAGEYTYVVRYDNVSKTLTVNIINDHIVEILKSYNEVEIAIDEINNFDFTSLFSLYVDGKAIQVNENMIDKSSLVGAVVNQVYTITLSYELEDTVSTETIKIKIIDLSQIIINAKDLVIYPNSERIDLTTLFTITKGNKNIPVTIDMITGSIDYDNDGLNEITINYQNITKKAIVEVRRGVIIETPKTDTITIIKGTNQANYSFVNDFKVIINGIHFDSIPYTYISENNVDFTTPGEYTVTLKIPYNDKRLGISGVKFVYYEKTITYKVVENKYTIDVLEDLVSLPYGTESYNVFNNLKVTINNRNQTLTEIKEHVDVITCYAKVVSESLDFNKVGIQFVEVEVYVNGVNSDPVVVNYNVIIESNVIVTANDTIAFTGDTVYARDLFKISDNAQEIKVTDDMITGKIDTFKPGVYTVTINYLGITKNARVVIYDSAIKGVYHTDFTTIPEKEEDDDEYEYGEGYYEEDFYSLRKAKDVSPYSDLIIDENGKIVLNGKEVEIINGIDENSMIIRYYNYDYTLCIDNGIVTLDPDNSIKLLFNDYKRPLVYFSEDLWTIDSKVIINYGTNHVLMESFNSYSIDIFNLTSNIDGTKLSYGLKVHLVEKTSADTFYKVTFSEVEFDENFEMISGTLSSLKFAGEVYRFQMETNNTGKINRNSDIKKYSNMTFNGIIDNNNARLVADSSESFTLYIDKTRIFSLSSLQISNIKNGGIDYSNDTLFVYSYSDEFYSYKFTLNVNDKTFELVEKDKYYGYYVYSNKMIFIDGYGTGHISFDTKSYYTTVFTYTIENNYMTIKYHDILPSFKYGNSAKFYIDSLLNVLTVKELSDAKLEGAKFENSIITDGAIVRINSLKVGQNADSIAKAELFDNIEIITRDGVMDRTSKANCITTSSIKFNTPGFYQFTITIEVEGIPVVSYYAIQIIESIYKDNPIVGIYGSGVINEKNSLSIDQYGQVILNCNDVIYEGMIVINNDFTFSAKLLNKDNQSVTLTGGLFRDGIIIVQCSGIESFNDYFTKGTSCVSGVSGTILRQIKVGGNITFIYAVSESMLGEVVDVTSINGINATEIGALLEINLESKIYVKINSWNDLKTGLVISDKYRGTYTKEGSQTIILDGFGNATVGTISGTYILNNNNVTITSISTTKVFALDITSYTYEEVNVNLDNTLVEGKVFNGSYTFVCYSYKYTADTSFTFGKNGIVTIKSTSVSHDDGDDACTEDVYSPIFASKAGVNGNYSVSGNKLTIKVNGINFVFVINDVLNVNTIVCVSSTLDSNEHGYFDVNTKFTTN